MDQQTQDYLKGLSYEDKADLRDRLASRLETEGVINKRITPPTGESYKPKNKPSALTQYTYGLEEMQWSVKNAIEIGKRGDPMTKAINAIQAEKFERIKKGENPSDVLQWEQQETHKAQSSIKIAAMSEMIRQQQLQAREKELSTRYAGVYGTEYANSGFAWAGRIHSLLTDPINAIPVLGQEGLVAKGISWISKKGLEKIGVLASQGGAITAMDQAIQDMYKTGEIDPKNAAFAGTLGAVLMPLAVMGGDHFISWMKAKKTAKSPVTAEEAGQIAERYGMDLEMLDTSALAGELNESILKQSAAESFDKLAGEVSGASQLAEAQAKEAIENTFGPEMVNEVSAVATTYESLAADLAAFGKAASPDERAALAEKIAETSLARELEAAGEALPTPPKGPTKRAAVDRAKSDVEEFKAQEALVRGAEESVAAFKARQAAAERFKPIEAGIVRARKQQEIPAVLKKTPQPRYDTDQSPQALARREATRDKEFELSTELTRQAGMRGAKEDPWFLKKQAEEVAPVVGPRQPGEVPLFFKKQAGGMSAQMATQIASTSAGAGLGYVWEGEEGAVIGALVGMGLPYASRKAFPLLKAAIDAPGKIDDYLIESTWGSAFSRPWKRLQVAGGNAGKQIALKLDEAQKLTRERSAKLFYPLQKMFKGTDEAFQTNVVQVLQGRAKPISAKAGEAAAHIRKLFNGDLDDAVSRGLIKADEAAKLKAAGGYFPRIYNEVFLSTDKGKELWVSQLTGVKFKPGDSSVMTALSHILHGKDTDISDFIKLEKPFKQEGEYLVLTRKAALRLLEKHRTADPRSRSRHLEKSRVFPKEWDAVLEPFMVKNPVAVMANYIDDTSKRMEFAKVFGANDEEFNRLADILDNEHSVPMGDVARQEYYKEVGDAERSRIIANQIGQSELQKRMWGGLNALATLKMTMSAILDLTQIPVMASSYLGKSQGPLQMARTYYKGIKGIFQNEPGELGKDASELAAAAIDTTLLQYMSEGKLGSTLGGLLPGRLGEKLRDPNYFKGVLSPLNIMNNPVAFLKAFGHLPAEHLNRLVAGSMGRAHFEYLMGIKGKLERNEIKFMRKRAEEKVRKGLEELRIDPDKKVSEYNKDDYVRAANAFSDIVNFRNDSDMPHWMQESPFWKLATKFKSYGFKQGAYIKEHILPPAKEFITSGGMKGDLMPLAYYLGVGTTVGMAADEFKRWILSDDRELTWTERILRAQFQFGGLGLMLDATVRLTSTYAGDTVSFVFGPVGSTLWDMASVEFPRTADRAKEHGVLSEEALASLAHTVIKEPTGNFPGKKQMLDDLKEIYGRKKRKKERGKAKNRGLRTTGSY